MSISRKGEIHYVCACIDWDGEQKFVDVDSRGTAI